MSTVRLETPTVSDHQLTQLLESLESSRRNVADWANNRGSQRRRLRLPCQVHYAAPGGGEILCTFGRTRDVSKLGIGLIVPMAWAAGTEVRMSFKMEEHRPVSLTGCVVFSRPTHLRWYMMGVRFQMPKNARLSQLPTAEGGP